MAECSVTTAMADVVAERDVYRELVEQQGDLLVKVDAEGRFLFVNQSYCLMFGRTSEELIGQSFLPLVHPEDQAATAAAVATLSHPPHACVMEQRAMTKDGWRWLQWSDHALLDADGRISAIIGVGRDIDAHKRQQAEREEQHQVVQAMLDHLPIGIFMVRAQDGQPLLANRVAIDLLGRGVLPVMPGGNLAQVYAAYRACSDEPYPVEAMPVMRAMRGEYHRADDIEVERPDGSRRCLEVVGCPVLDPEGRVWAGLVGFFDITQRRQAEAEHRRLQQQIQQTQKLESLGVLAGGIAHDFNNILMAVIGHAELAMRKLSPVSPAREHLFEIERAARRSAELCNQMLAYAGRASFSRGRLQVCDLVDEMIHLLKTSISKKAILNVRSDRGLPPIFADASQIRQIILNLIVNASDAIGERSGVISICIGATRCDAAYLASMDLVADLVPGTYVHIEVSDTGCGMDQATLARIFEPFFTTKFTGRGLGLAAVLGIVKAHQGAIKVYSEIGIGTTFKLLLPAVSESVVVAAGPSTQETSTWRGSGTVLIADDEETLRALFADLFESLGYTVIAVEDGRQAVEVYRQQRERIELVVLDLTMPHMDGAEAYGELRRIDPDVRVIIASGYAQDDVGARFAGKRLAGVLQKPFTVEQLTAILSTLPSRQ